MKRFWGICLVFLILVGVCTPAYAEGTLFLRDAKVVFSTIGETADIYGGSIPAEDVLWESSDPNVIRVEKGKLTAVGVGSAVVQASFGEQTLECDVSCLAKDRDELRKLPIASLQLPHRIAAEVDFDPTEFYSDAVLIGDSVMYAIYVHETANNMLGHPLFLARKNISTNNFYHYIINLYYQGAELHVEDAVAASGAKKAFFMLGMNDVGYQTPDEIIGKYRTVIDRVREKSPEIEIYLQTCLPFYFDSYYFPSFNSKIDEFNAKLADLAEEMDCHFVEVADYIKDSLNNMAHDYCSDFYVHMNQEGSVAWLKAMRAYAYEQLLK